MDQNIVNQLSGNIGWKDTKLRHLGCNQNLASALNLHSPRDIIGLRDSDLPLNSEQDSIFHFEKDQLALQGQTTRFVHHHQDKLYFVIKKPMLDLNLSVCGIIYQCHIIEKSLSYEIRPNSYPYSLSKRELQCMFYIVRGKTNKQIAEILKLSKRTIDFYMENIKNKLGCQSKNELIIKAIDAGHLLLRDDIF